MQKEPLEILFDRVFWTPISGLEKAFAKEHKIELCATHTGILHIDGYDFKVYMMSSGDRVLDMRDFDRFMELRTKTQHS